MTRTEAEILVDDLLNASFLYETEDMPRSSSKYRTDFFAAKEAVIAALVDGTAQ